MGNFLLALCVRVSLVWLAPCKKNGTFSHKNLEIAAFYSFFFESLFSLSVIFLKRLFSVHKPLTKLPSHHKTKQRSCTQQAYSSPPITSTVNHSCRELTVSLPPHQKVASLLDLPDQQDFPTTTRM